MATASPPTTTRSTSGPDAFAGTNSPDWAEPVSSFSFRSLVQPNTTPGWLRLWGLIVVVAVGGFAFVGTLAALDARESATTIESSTAPSLVAVQDLFSSVAEANASATGAFLSGLTDEENRAQRNLYLDAIRRSSRQLEDVSSLVGDDAASHEALQTLISDLTLYSGEIEASRVSNLSGLAGAEDQLAGALDRAGTDMALSVATVTASTDEELDALSGSGLVLQILALVLGAVAIGLLLWFQVQLGSRTNRILNPPLAAATMLVLVAVGWFASGLLVRDSALDNARSGGFESIQSTAAIQTDVYETQTLVSLRLITGRGDSTESLLDGVGSSIERARNAADSTRELAAVDLLDQRFDRYRMAIADIERLAQSGRADEAISLLEDEGLSTFTGVNTSIESVLSDNRRQFLSGVADAVTAVDRLPLVLVVLPVLAALSALYGIQLRLREYS